MKVVQQKTKPNSPKKKGNKINKIEMPSFMMEMERGLKIRMLKMDDDDLDVSQLSAHNFKTIPNIFERISEYFEWKDLFPK